MKQITTIKMWPGQKAFWEAGPQPTLYLGGVGAGKSYIGVMKLLYLLDQYPGSRGVIVRQKFNQLKKTVAATLWKLLPRDRIARRNENEGLIKLTNGSELLLMHLDRSDSIDNLKSLELNFAYIDQAEDISAEAWDTLWERLGRWSGAVKRGGWPKDWPYRTQLGDPIPPRYLMAGAYSPGYDHWLTSRFWEHGGERDRYREMGYLVVKGSTRENLALSQEYVKDRLSQGEEYVRRFVDATDWGAKEGRIFNLVPASIIEPTAEIMERIRRSFRLHRVLDHGEYSPTACLWYATDTRGNVIFYQEYLAADKLVSEHREAIYEISKLDGDGVIPPKYYSQYADPAIFAKNRGRSVNSAPTYSVADEYLDRKLAPAKTAIAWRPAVNDEAATINRVREYLKPTWGNIHPFVGGGPGKAVMPRVYFVRRGPNNPFGCHEVISDIRAARRVEVGTAPDGSKLFGDERDPRVRDHLLDGVRYALIMRPALGPVAPEPPPEPGHIRIDDYFKAMANAQGEAAAEFHRNFKGHSETGY